MRTFISGLLLLLSGVSSAVAQSDISPVALVGKWSASAKHPSGVNIVSRVVFTQAMKFSGATTVDDKPLMEFTGTWALSGTTLIWRYETSTNTALTPGTIDTDEVVSAGDSKLVLRSKLTGKQNVNIRSN